MKTLTVYRGSDYTTRIESNKTKNTGIFTSDNIYVALSYAGNTGYLTKLTLLVEDKDILYLNCNGNNWRKAFNGLSSDNLIRKYKQENPTLKLIVLTNTIDSGAKYNKLCKIVESHKPSNVYCIIDNSIIKNSKTEQIKNLTNPINFSNIDMNNIKLTITTKDNQVVHGIENWNRKITLNKSYTVIEIKNINTNEVIGQIGLEFSKNSICWFFCLAINPKYRHNNLGTQLIKFAENFCKEKGITTLKLRPEEKFKTKLIDWYKKLGYVNITKDKYGLVMSKHI